MPDFYETYGPFSLSGENADFLGRPSSDFWAELEDIHPGLAVAIGVYVISSRTRNGAAIPWYVGMTERGFEGRFAQHRKTFLLLKAKCNTGSMEIYFIARRTPKKGSFIGVGKTRRSEIHALESRLIETCLKRNPELHNNRKVKSLTDVIVPGYMNERPGKRTKSADSFNQLITGNLKSRMTES